MRSATRLFRSVLLGSAFCAFAASAHAGPYTLLYNFAGPPNDGSYPYNDVSFDAGGDLYGATNLGGAADAGTIFKIAAGGTETVLHSFDGAAGGSDPNAGVTLDPATGDLTGSTTFGGSGGCRNGCGILYRLAADGTFTVLHTFKGGKDGENPAARLIRDGRGNYYGIAAAGPDGGGMVFRYGANGAFKVLHAFGGPDGFSPQGSLLLDGAGNLYGVTNSGGTDNYGVVYRLGTNGKTFSVLYSFTGGADGGYPSGGLAGDKAGNLYGATNLAGNGEYPNGTVFRLAPDGTLTTLYVFTGGKDGGYPQGDLLQEKGQLYGTTTGGGADNDGVVYKVDAAGGSETVLHTFRGDDGATPQAGLTRNHGRLYGTASSGGTDGYGVVFRVKMK
jgi:uncharacterized repeat protein (TIGR03803 family)